MEKRYYRMNQGRLLTNRLQHLIDCQIITAISLPNTNGKKMALFVYPNDHGTATIYGQVVNKFDDINLEVDPVDNMDMFVVGEFSDQGEVEPVFGCGPRNNGHMSDCMLGISYVNALLEGKGSRYDVLWGSPVFSEPPQTFNGAAYTLPPVKRMIENLKKTQGSSTRLTEDFMNQLSPDVLPPTWLYPEAFDSIQSVNEAFADGRIIGVHEYAIGSKQEITDYVQTSEVHDHRRVRTVRRYMWSAVLSDGTEIPVGEVTREVGSWTSAFVGD